jgi:hypothetical protein
MQIQEMKQLMKAIDDLEAEFAKQQAECQNKMEAMQTALRRMGQQMPRS